MKFLNTLQVAQEIVVENKTTVEIPGKVVLYNDDWHTFDEVIFQLMKAVNCSLVEARNYAFEVHFTGRAIVFSGGLIQCLKVSSVFEEIALHTQVVT